MSEKRRKVKATKGQFKELLQWHVGAGVLMLHTADNEVMTVEVYTGKDNMLRCVGDGSPVLPIVCHDSIDGQFVIERAHNNALAADDGRAVK